MKKPIPLAKLRQIIREELEEAEVSDVSVSSSKNMLDHEGAAAVVGTASKLISALDAFLEKAPQQAKDALMNRVPDLRPTLEDMVQSPGSYVTKSAPKDVEASQTDSPQSVEQQPQLRVAPSRPVLDHKVVETINSRIRAKRKA